VFANLLIRELGLAKKAARGLDQTFQFFEFSTCYFELIHFNLTYIFPSAGLLAVIKVHRFYERIRSELPYILSELRVLFWGREFQMNGRPPTVDSRGLHRGRKFISR